MLVKFSDNVKYTGFESNFNKRITTNKPNHSFLHKDYFTEIGNYSHRKINRMDNQNRWVTSYERDMSPRSEKCTIRSKNSDDNKSYEEGLQKIVNDISSSPRDEKILPNNNLHSPYSKYSGIQFTSNYNESNINVLQSYENFKSKNPNSKLFKFPEIYSSLNLPKNRGNRSPNYKSEYKNTFGQEISENPKDKFSKFIQNQKVVQLETDYGYSPYIKSNIILNSDSAHINSSSNNSQTTKRYYDNYDLSKGTTRISEFMQYYKGHIPKADIHSTPKNLRYSDTYQMMGKIIFENIDTKPMPGYTGYANK
jgi:hypothetical protein